MSSYPDLPGGPMVYDNFPEGGHTDLRFVAVGEGSTELIPRLWAERILGELRSSKPAVWRSLVGKASTAGASSGGA